MITTKPINPAKKLQIGDIFEIIFVNGPYEDKRLMGIALQNTKRGKKVSILFSEIEAYPAKCTFEWTDVTLSNGYDGYTFKIIS